MRYLSSHHRQSDKGGFTQSKTFLTEPFSFQLLETQCGSAICSGLNNIVKSRLKQRQVTQNLLAIIQTAASFAEISNLKPLFMH